MATLSLGVALGAGNLTAAVHPGAVTRWTTQLSLAPHVPPEAGLPEENPRVRTDGLTFSGFVERVGDPVPIAGPGGQTFAAEVLLLDAVKSLVRAQLAGFDAPPPLVIACPAYWSEGAREAFAAAVGSARLPQPLRLETDLVAAFARLRQLPDLPRTGLIALADLGATGTTVAIGDAATGKLVGDRLRLDEPNGTDLDHALLSYLLAQVADPTELTASDPNLVAALDRLRSSVRSAKERLSADSVTSVAVDLPMYRGEVRITRAELDDLAGEPISAVTTALRDLIDRGGGSVDEIAGVALCGGGAAMPLVSTRLSADFHTAVVVDADPAATAARGAAGLASTMAPRPPRPQSAPSGPLPADCPPTGPARRLPPRAAGGIAAAGAAGAAAAGAAAAAAQPRAGDTAQWQSPPRNPTSSGDLPVGPAEHGGNAVTFAPRDDAPPPARPSRTRMIAFIGAGAVAFALGVGGVAFALSSNDTPAGPTTSSSISTSLSSSTKTTTTTEPTTEFTPAPEQGVPDNQGGQTTWESSTSESSTEPSWTEPSGTTTAPTPPPVTTQAPTPTPGS